MTDICFQGKRVLLHSFSTRGLKSIPQKSGIIAQQASFLSPFQDLPPQSSENHCYSTMKATEIKIPANVDSVMLSLIKNAKDMTLVLQPAHCRVECILAPQFNLDVNMISSYLFDSTPLRCYLITNNMVLLPKHYSFASISKGFIGINNLLIKFCKMYDLCTT